MSYLKRMYDRYKSGWNPFISVVDEGDRYVFTARRKDFSGFSKSIVFDKNDRFTGGSRRWVPSERLEEETLDFNDPPESNPEILNPNLDTITSDYSTLDG